MKQLQLMLLGLSLLAGCAAGTGTLEEETVSPEELVEGCEALLDQGAAPRAVGSVEGSSRYVLDTDEGRCIEEAEELIDTLERHDENVLVRSLAENLQGLLDADPSPHPDMPGQLPKRGSVAADPSPHPDRPIDGADDGVVVIIWIVVVEDDDSKTEMMTGSHR